MSDRIYESLGIKSRTYFNNSSPMCTDSFCVYAPIKTNSTFFFNEDIFSLTCQTVSTSLQHPFNINLSNTVASC